MRREFQSYFYLLVGVLFVSQTVAAFSVPVWGSSEAREAHVILEMIYGGSWLLPLRNGIIASKPPLFHWFGSSLGMIFGSTDIFIPRLVSIFSAIGVVFLTAAIASIECSRQSLREQREKVATVAVVILCTSWLFFAQIADAKVDMHFCWWVTLATASIMAKEHCRFGLLGSPIVFALATAASILTKGPLGAVLIAFFSAIILVERKSSWRRWLYYIFLGTVGVLVAGGWYVYGVVEGGTPFIHRHILFENVKRVTGTVDKMNSQAPWFYLGSIHRTMFPWIFVLYFYAYKKRKIPFGVGCFFGLLVLLSIASGKRHSYLLPGLPLFSVGLANLIVASALRENNFLAKVPKKKIAHMAAAVLVIMTVCQVAGLNIKGGRKPYDVVARQIYRASEGKKLFVIKTWWDESFDVVLYRLQKKVEIVPLEDMNAVNSRLNNETDALCISHRDIPFIPENLLLSMDKPLDLIMQPCEAVVALQKER